MPKVLGKAGESLADVYDVEGSIAGVEELLSKDVNLVHEMGATIFSERLRANVIHTDSAAIAASTLWAVSVPRPTQHERVLGLIVVAGVTARMTRVTVSFGEGSPELECPIWTWEVGAGADFERSINVELASGVQNRFQLVPSNATALPNLILRAGQPSGNPQITMRGVTSAFGAGTVITSLFLYTCAAGPGGLSSKGLPIPGW